MSDSTLASARRPIRFGNTEYLASPLTDRDIAELDEWIQEHYIDLARRSLRSSTSEADRELTMRVAMREALTLTWLSGQGARIIGTIDGLTRLLWQMVQHNHPNVTPAQLRAHLTDPRTLQENISRINDTFEKLNVGPERSFQKDKKDKKDKDKKERKKTYRPVKNSR